MRGAYRDRDEAGAALALEVADVVRGPCVVAAIPRGGIVVAAPVAQRLGAPLTLAFARKIALPLAPELAVGALDEDGVALLDHGLLAALVADAGERAAGAEALEAARERVRAEIERQRTRYGAPALAGLVPGTSVVLVDDGIATGLTIRAAIAYARRHEARAVIVATPCASQEAAARIARDADRLVCPIVDPGFFAVGAYYGAFPSVSDDEVVAALASARRAAPSTTPPVAAPPAARG